MRNSKKISVLLSYINILMGMMINLILTPLLIDHLTDESYSMYKVMQSFVGPLIMFNLGVSTIVARSVARYQATDEKNLQEKKNTFATAILVSVLMAALVVGIGAIMSFSIPGIYGANYSRELIREGQMIFGVGVMSTALQIVTEAFKGCIIGHEKFVFQYGAQSIQYILRFGWVLLAIKLGWGAVAVSLSGLINIVIILFAYVIYALFVLKERPHLYRLNKNELIQIFSFSLAILLQTIVNQVNNNVDLMILGAVEINKEIITMYSSALTIYTVYNSMITVFANLYFPQAVKEISKGSSPEALTNFVIKPGRIQATVAMAVVFGFAVLGRDFISLWIGEKYMSAYYVTLMLIIPVTIPLVQNVCISILDARLKRMFRSVMLLGMAAINICVSFVLVRFIGFWGTALGTVVALIIGNVIVMNIYYKKVIGIQVFRMFKEIFRGILPAGLLAGILNIPSLFIGQANIWLFLLKGLVFLTIYVVFLWLFGLNSDEKKQVKRTFKHYKS